MGAGSPVAVQKQNFQEMEMEMDELSLCEEDLSRSSEKLERERLSICESLTDVEQERASANRQSSELMSELAKASNSRFGLLVPSQSVDSDTSSASAAEEHEVQHLKASLHKRRSSVRTLETTLWHVTQRGQEQLALEAKRIRSLEEQLAELWCEKMSNEWKLRTRALDSEAVNTGEAEDETNETGETVETTGLGETVETLLDLGERSPGLAGELAATMVEGHIDDVSVVSSMTEDSRISVLEMQAREMSNACLREENENLEAEEAELQAVLQQAQQELLAWRSRISNKAAA